MSTDVPEEFPRQEFRKSRLPYQLAVYATSMILPVIVMRTLGVVLSPIWSVGSVVYLIAWCAIAAGCFVLLTKLLSRMDFEKPAVTIGPDAVIFLQFQTRVLPWTSVSKIKFYESGRFRESKSLVFHMAGGGKETVNLYQLAGISGRQLFETIRTYHRKFGSQPAQVGAGYDASAWTGIDDE